MNTTDVTALVAEPTLDGYEQKARDLLSSYRNLDDNSVKYVARYYPGSSQFNEINLCVNDFTIEDAQLALARGHGFTDYNSFVSHICDLSDENSITCRFERAVDATVNGDKTTLFRLLKEDPDLVRKRSTRAHQALLIHYLAANGVEIYRQKSPANAPELAEILLGAGSEADAPADVYGSKWCTTMDLLVSSVHPAQAGVQTSLVEKLLDHGAAINGCRDDCSPLLTSICFHYPQAAETLVRRGARIDTIVAAAAMGFLDQVKGFLNFKGNLKHKKSIVQVPWADCRNFPGKQLELALVWAAMHDRSYVVTYLLDNGVSIAATDFRQWTALHWAAFYGYPETFQVLLDNKAPLEARNESGGTVLDQTLWATVHQGVGPHHLSIIEKLIKAGAKIHSWWLFANLTTPLDERVAKLLTNYMRP